MRRLHVRGTSTVKVSSSGTELEDLGRFHLQLWRIQLQLEDNPQRPRSRAATTVGKFLLTLSQRTYVGSVPRYRFW